MGEDAPEVWFFHLVFCAGDKNVSYEKIKNLPKCLVWAEMFASSLFAEEKKR